MLTLLQLFLSEVAAHHRVVAMGIEDRGEPVVEELLLVWLDPFLTLEEHDRLLGRHLGVSL